MALVTCGTPCTVQDDCPSGQKCHPSLPLNPCRANQPQCTPPLVPPIFKKVSYPTIANGGFIPGYVGSVNMTVDEDGVITFPVEPETRGCRLNSTFKAATAKVCAEIRTPLVSMNGTVFAFYLMSDQQQRSNDKPWWEVDFEFLGRSAGQVWLNKYEAGRIDPWATGYMPLSIPHNEWNTYCIDWNVRTKCVKWIVNDEVRRALPLSRFWTVKRPLSVMFSHWVVGSQFRIWGGGNGTISERREAHVRNITLWRSR